MTASPLHQTALDSDEAWGAKLEMDCVCGGKLLLWDKKCKGCNAKNPFPRLLKKRKQVEQFLDQRIHVGLMPKLDKAQLLLESARKYDKVLLAVLNRPFPEQQKKEEINLFMHRVVNFFPSMFKSSSPKKTAQAVGDSIKRSSVSMARIAWKECEGLLDGLTGLASSTSFGQGAGTQPERVAGDLLLAAKPYIEALKTLQLAHTRMQTAYAPAKEIFERPLKSKGTKGLWNKARLKFKPVGERLRLPTAIWENPDEHEELKRLDAQLGKFLDQIRWFSNQRAKLEERNDRQMNTYRLSLRKHLVLGLARRYAAADPAARPMVVKRVLSQKGVGSWLWRLLFGVRGAGVV